MTFEKMKPILALVALWGVFTIAVLALLASYDLAAYIPWVLLGTGVSTVAVIAVSIGHSVFVRFKQKDREGGLRVEPPDKSSGN